MMFVLTISILFGREVDVTIRTNYKKSQPIWGVHNLYKETHFVTVKKDDNSKSKYVFSKKSPMSKLTFKGKNIIFLVPELIDNVTSIIVREFRYVRDPKKKSMAIQDANNALFDLFKYKLREMLLGIPEIKRKYDIDELLSVDTIFFKEYFCQKKRDEIACKMNAIIDLDAP